MDINTTPRRGGLLINKQAGITSHDVIYQLRKMPPLRGIKIGHSGTLDPFATGVLLVLVDGAVRLQDELHLLPKTYRAEMTLGANTDTDDATGEFLPRLDKNKETLIPSPKQVLAALDNIKQQTAQIPPIYSAIQIGGKRMYKLAREGRIVEQKPRNIIIHDITLEHYSYPTITITVTCGTGTYIRAIARDIGAMLGTGGYCSQLERTAIGNFQIQNAHTIQDLPLNIHSVLIPLEQLTEHLQSISFPDSNVAKLKNGREVEIPQDTPENTPIVLKNSGNKVFGIGIRQPDTLFITPKKIFL